MTEWVRMCLQVIGLILLGIGVITILIKAWLTDPVGGAIASIMIGFSMTVIAYAVKEGT